MIHTVPTSRSKRYWALILFTPFTTMILAMMAYVIIHHFAGLPEWRLKDGLIAVPASMLEALFWVLFVVLLQYLILLRVYRLDFRTALSSRAEPKSQKTNGVPATLAALSGFALALALSRTLVAADLFSGAASWVFAVLSAVDGLLIGPLINLGEERSAERNCVHKVKTDR